MSVVDVTRHQDGDYESADRINMLIVKEMGINELEISIQRYA